MNETVVVKSRGGIGTLNLLGIVFVVLKLIGVINWSWWLVTLPLWIGWAFALFFFIIAFIIILIGAIIEAIGGY